MYFQVRKWMRLPPGPWSILLVLGQGSALGSTDSGLFIRCTDACSSQVPGRVPNRALGWSTFRLWL